MHPAARPLATRSEVEGDGEVGLGRAGGLGHLQFSHLSVSHFTKLHDCVDALPGPHLVVKTRSQKQEGQRTPKSTNATCHPLGRRPVGCAEAEVKFRGKAVELLGDVIIDFSGILTIKQVNLVLMFKNGILILFIF